MPDAADRGDRWPRFEMVAFPAPTGVPHGWDAELLREGVPKALFGAYEAASELTPLEVSGYGQVVRFGSSGFYGSVCLDPRTGAVVYVRSYAPDRTIDPARAYPGPPVFINSSVDQFTASVRATLARFPFDRGDAERESREGGDRDEIEGAIAEEWDRAADELEATLGTLDPAAVADPDAFWMTFLDDVRIGDYATDDILSDPDE